MAIKKSLNIIVVDQTGSSFQSINQILKTIGLKRTQLIKSVKDCTAMLSSKQEEVGLLICCDLDDQTIIEIRAVSDVPIILVTDHIEQVIVMKYIKAGISSMIVRPYSADSFINNLVKL